MGTIQPMVLLDHGVRFVDELEAFIQESGGIPYDEAIGVGKGKSREVSIRAQELRKEVEVRAFEALRERKAAAAAAVQRKVPLAFSFEDDDDAAYYHDMLEGTEPCLCEVADPPAVTRLSIKIAWPPSRHICFYPGDAFIAGTHKSLLLICLGNCIPGNYEPGFYMVYDTQANSVAIVPPILPRFGNGLSPCSPPFQIARGWGGGTVAIQSRASSDADGGGYLLAELLYHTDGRNRHPTSKATLFTWISGGAGEWISEEVELPISSRSFRADMVFAVGPTSLCWVDLLSGVLVYNHATDDDDTASSGDFHFIPLHPGIEAIKKLEHEVEMGWPEEYRSMCCIDDEDTLQFVSIEGFLQDIPMADKMLTTWILKSPRSPTEWQWHLLQSVRIGDLWHDPHYNDLPLLPSFPVISMLQPHVIYLSVHNYEYNPKHELMQATELYVLSIDMRLRGVVSAFNAPPEKKGCAPYLKTFTSDFTRYLNQTSDDLYKVCRTGKDVSDGGESAWTSVWISVPTSCASSALQMSVQDADMSSDSDMSKVFEDTSFVTSNSSISVREILSGLPSGMETKEWGGIDPFTKSRCHHGKQPRRLLCWDGKNTGRRYLACALREKTTMCNFIEWKDEKWPAMFQEVVGNLLEVVAKFKKQAERAHFDLLGAIQMRNDTIKEKEALLEEKAAWAREKEHLTLEKERLERELTLRTRLARTTSSTLENRIKSDVHKKKMLFRVIMALFGLLVAILFGVILKNE